MNPVSTSGNSPQSTDVLNTVTSNEDAQPLQVDEPIYWSVTRTGKAAMTPLDPQMFDGKGLTKFCKTTKDLPKTDWVYNAKSKHTKRAEAYHGDVIFDAEYVRHWIERNLLNRLMPHAETIEDYKQVWDAIALNCPEVGSVAPTAIHESALSIRENCDSDELPDCSALRDIYASLSALIASLG
ncbi:hypothetical protein Lepto7376_3870 [[Leptolyngbya] sp. PCC 7376]|nr:hypothetical protein Lepto7376_3870 [[Leptolyngbya] sp. PCC 7376]